MEKLLEFLNGRKTTIGTVLGAIVTYCLGKGYIGADEANLLSVVLVSLGLTANIINAKKK